MTVRVVLAEDSYLAREAVASVIERADGIELVATCADLESLEAAIDENHPDVVVTDIRMPPTNTDEGIRFATDLRKSEPEIGVVVLSHHNEPALATALFETGSERRAYLLKERVKDSEELVRTLRSVAEGGSVVDPAVVEKLLVTSRARERSKLEHLTPRELEILGLIAEGRSNSAIAETLFLTKRAVERHINSIFTKLDLGDPAEISRRVRAALAFLADNTG